MRTGVQGRELPKYYGHFKTIHKRFLPCAKKHIGNDVFSFFEEEADMVMVQS